MSCRECPHSEAGMRQAGLMCVKRGPTYGRRVEALDHPPTDCPLVGGAA